MDDPFVCVSGFENLTSAFWTPKVYDLLATSGRKTLDLRKTKRLELHRSQKSNPKANVCSGGGAPSSSDNDTTSHTIADGALEVRVTSTRALMKLIEKVRVMKY